MESEKFLLFDFYPKKGTVESGQGRGNFDG